MKKGQVYEGVIESVDFPNKGKIRLAEEEKTVIVKNGISGQKVRFSVNKIRKGKAEGRILEVLEKAPAEIQPSCPHFGECGGCTYQNLPYEEQLGLKEQQVKAMMDEAVEGDYVWEGVLPSPVAFAYRNKMEFSFGDEYKDGPLALGMHKRGSFHDIVNVEHCQIVDEDYRKILTCTLEASKRSGLPYYHRMRHTGYFRHLLVRKAVKTGEILIDLVTTDGRDCGGEREITDYLEKWVDDLCRAVKTGEILIDLVTTDGRDCGGEREITDYLEKWVDDLCRLSLDGKIAGILHTTNNSVADVVKDEGTETLYGQGYFYEELLGLKFKITPFSFFQTNILHTTNNSVADVVKDEGTETLYGQGYFYEELLGLKFKITPFSFFQTNSLGAEVLYEKAREYMGDTKDRVVFDLYSGTGTIAQILAPVAKKVVGVEIVEEAVEAAKENAKLNGLENCKFWAGDVLKVIDELGEVPDLIMLDPPRDGVNPKALRKIIDFGVDRMVYIACKPTSLARDLEMLQGRGYQVEKIACVDLFPNTVHVETVMSWGKFRISSC